jgi:hypothetical protein
MALTKVTSNVLADNAVTTGKILDDAVTTGKILDDAVTTLKILDLNVTTGKIIDDAVTTGKILDLNVTTGKLATSSVTSVKVGTEFTTVAVLTPGATIDVSYTAAQVFTLTPNANTTLNIINPVIGVAKTIIVTGAGGTNTIAYTVGGAAGTFNLIAGEYDDTSAKKNFIQITCVSATEFWYSISQIAV